ncbi:MAG: hypothetical protein ABSF51_08820 [Verrucomicrobiota bacterium]|jgi:hypothetical protein
MMTGSQILRNRVSTGATARLDRGFAEPDLDQFAEQDLGNWLHQVAGKIGLAISWRIPVGFEDETGFHLGVQPGREDGRREWEPAGIFTDGKHF